MQLPPVYTGKWANATNEEVEEELAKGTPYTFRFRVPKGGLKINDLIRGEVSSFHPSPVSSFCLGFFFLKGTINDFLLHVVVRIEYFTFFLYVLPSYPGVNRYIGSNIFHLVICYP